MARECKICGAEIPPRIGRGRPRTRCEGCAPSVKTPSPDARVVQMPTRQPAGNPERGGIVARVRSRLEAIGQLDSIHGDLAMEAARQIEAGASASAAAVLLDRIARNFEAAQKAAQASPGTGADEDGVDWGVG